MVNQSILRISLEKKKNRMTLSKRSASKSLLIPALRDESKGKNLRMASYCHEANRKNGIEHRDEHGSESLPLTLAHDTSISYFSQPEPVEGSLFIF